MLHLTALRIVLNGMVHHLLFLQGLVEGSDLFKPLFLFFQTLFLLHLHSFRHLDVERLTIWQSLHWFLHAAARHASQAYLFSAARRHRERRCLSQGTALGKVADRLDTGAS